MSIAAPSGDSVVPDDPTARPSIDRAPPEQTSPPTTDGDRALLGRYEAVLQRIERAAQGAGRDPAGIRLLAVSKTFGADAVLALAGFGQRAFGENYVQEALPKVSACRDRWSLGASGRSVAPLEWHYIGPIQSNKTRLIAESFDWVLSVDRESIARRLSDQRPAALAPLQVCIQVDVSGEAGKQGCEPAEALVLARAVAGLPRLALRGVMAIPAVTDDPGQQRAQFARVRAVYEALRAEGLPVDTLSMGMSGDLESAIAEGATLVRVGTALFGARPPRPGVRPSA
jgi:pyridoxal phosphate enzyme (YggS family)